MATLPELPGYVVTEIHGVVTAVSTQNVKGSKGKAVDSLETAMYEIRAAAWDKGGNAVLGLKTSTFAASIGGAMGDAVGVVVVGTAVVLEVDES